MYRIIIFYSILWRGRKTGNHWTVWTEINLAALYDASLRVQSFLIEVLRLTFQVLQQTRLVNHAVVGDIERRVFIDYNNLNSIELLQINNLNNSW